MNVGVAEEQFLQAWMHDELHFREGTGPAKRLQRAHQVMPFDLALLIAAWLPDPNEQFQRAEEPLPEAPVEWPWQTPRKFETRLRQAKEELALRNGPTAHCSSNLDRTENSLRLPTQSSQ
jgi:hypothetical protein